MNITKERIDQFKAFLYIQYKYKDPEKQAEKLAYAICNYLVEYKNFNAIDEISTGINSDIKIVNLFNSESKLKLIVKFKDNDKRSPSWYIYPFIDRPITNTSIILYLFDKDLVIY